MVPDKLCDTMASKDRFNEAIIWDRDTLYPKYGINFRREYTQTVGVGQLREYELFFPIFNTQVVDEQAARLLNIEVGEQVIYTPRRSYDMWNTRYFIVAFDSNGWRDPSRASASFLFHSGQVFPDPARFTGPDGKERAKNWAETRDFKVIRNLVEYPPRGSSIARATRPVRHAVRSEEDETLREMLYAADPIWNNGKDRVYDPHNIAWMSRADLNEVRAYLSGLPTGPSETVKVTYPTPQQAVLEVNLSSPGLVILADAYYPGWELTVDGKERTDLSSQCHDARSRSRSGPSPLGLYLHAPYFQAGTVGLDCGPGRLCGFRIGVCTLASRSSPGPDAVRAWE